MATTKKQKRNKKVAERPPGKRQMAAAMVSGFDSIVSAFDGHPKYRDVMLATMHAAAYTQLRSLLMILPQIAGDPKGRQWALDVVERAAELSTQVFFHGLREDGTAFPSELPQSLRDVFTAGHHGIIENALAMLEYESERALEAAAGGDDADRVFLEG